MPVNALSNNCDGTTCGYTCQPGFIDCVKVGADTDGCETSSSSLTDCGTCGSACDTVNSIGAMCPAGVCLYSGCAAGRIDCNQTSPNADRCECSTPMCCGNACQPDHINGLGQNYLLKCVSLATPGN